MCLKLGFEATLAHSFGELKLPSSQTTLVRVVAVKRESELSVSLIGAGFPLSAAGKRVAGPLTDREV